VFTACSFYELVFVSQNGKDVFLLNGKMVDEMGGLKPIGVSLDAFYIDIPLETFSNFPTKQQAVVMVAAHRLKVWVPF